MNKEHLRNRTGNSIENLSAIRKIVFNLNRLDKSMEEKLTLKQKMTRYTNNFQNVENLIFMSFHILVNTIMSNFYAIAIQYKKTIAKRI